MTKATLPSTIPFLFFLFDTDTGEFFRWKGSWWFFSELVVLFGQSSIPNQNRERG